jgi:benzodiazapine receptor
MKNTDMKNKIALFLLFIASNFGALGIGVLLMNNGSSSEWYYSLNKAPWTPEGWIFGAAWFSIMLCYSIYMTHLVLQKKLPNANLIQLYVAQWLLNVSWNYIFFNQHLTILGFIVLLSLWLVIGYFTFKYIKHVKWVTLLIVPYLIWLTIAASLNGYIVLFN